MGAHTNLYARAFTMGAHTNLEDDNKDDPTRLPWSLSSAISIPVSIPLLSLG